MRIRCCFVLLLLVGAAPTTRPAAEANFPDAWLGHWKGDLVAESRQGAQRLTMELIITGTDDPKQFGWTIVYDGAAGRQERNYRLDTVDADAGTYQIDEKNGIVLPATRWQSDTLVSAFDVGGTTLVSTYRLTGNTLVSEIISSRPAGDADEHGRVGARHVTAVQRATMTRS